MPLFRDPRQLEEEAQREKEKEEKRLRARQSAKRTRDKKKLERARIQANLSQLKGSLSHEERGLVPHPPTPLPPSPPVDVSDTIPFADLLSWIAMVAVKIGNNSEYFLNQVEEKERDRAKCVLEQFVKLRKMAATANPLSVASSMRSLPLAPPLPVDFANGMEFSKAERNLLDFCSPQVGLQTLLGIANGVKPRGLAPLEPADSNEIGCWLAYASEPSPVHVTTALDLPRMTTKAPKGSGQMAMRRSSQLVHRVSVMTWKGDDDRRKMLVLREEVSHLCHHGNCFRPCHLVLETGLRNQQRKRCHVGRKCLCKLEPMCIFS